MRVGTIKYDYVLRRGRNLETHLQARERGLEQILCLKPSEGTDSADTLMLDFWSPELWKTKICCFKQPSPRYFLMAILAN